MTRALADEIVGLCAQPGTYGHDTHLAGLKLRDLMRANLPAILLALLGPDEAAIERAYSAVRDVNKCIKDKGKPCGWGDLCRCALSARAALAAAEREP